MPANIGYTIIECSGEDGENPCTELLAHTQDSKGWTTPRNGTFPQHVTLQLDHPSRLQQVQLLSHEYKIAGKIELQIASSTGSPTSKEPNFTRLGFLSFDPNDRTNFSARELKSVTLPDVEAIAVKLIIHRCHTNTMNTHSQASLIMLNLVGEPLNAPSSTNGNIKTAVAAAASSVPVLVVAAPPAPLTSSAATTTTTTVHKSVSVPEEDGVDEVTAQRIFELQEKKAAAVAIEDYDEAKKLKSAIEKLRAVGAKMAALETRKKAAVDAEDYDAAKALKIELEKMRHRAYAAIARGEHHDHHHNHHPEIQYQQPHNDVNNLTTVGGNTTNTNTNNILENSGGVLSNEINNGDIINATGTTGNNYMVAAAAAGAAPFSPALSSMDSYGSSDNAGLFNKNTTTTSHSSPEPFMQQKPTTSGGSSDWRSYDERPARAAGAYTISNLDEFNADSAPPGAVITAKTRGIGGIASPEGVVGPLRRIDDNAKTVNKIGSAAGNNNTAGAGEKIEVTCPPAPAGFPSELPLPEPLSPDDAKESGPMEALVGEFLTRCLYSKSWQLKEAGMTAIATAVGTSSADALPRLDGDGDALRLLCGVVAQGLKARIPAIAAAALVLLRSLVNSAAARRLPTRDMHAALTELLPIVAERAGDPAPRTREQAVEALVDIARVKESGLKSLTSIFSRPYKITESPKITQGRLHLLSALLPVLGVVSANSASGHLGNVDATLTSPSSPSPASTSGGFSAEAVIQFCCPALKSANAEVRSAAAKLVVKVGRAPGIGPQVVLPLLPVDVNPKLKQQLEEDLTGEKKIRPTRPGSNSNTANTTTTTTTNTNTTTNASAKKNTSATAGKGRESAGASGAAASATAVPANSRSRTTTTNSVASSRRTSNAAGATAGTGAGGAPPRAQASSRHHSSTTAPAAAASKAARNSRPPSSTCTQQQQQHYTNNQTEYDEEHLRPFQTPSSNAMPPPPPQQQQNHHEENQPFSPEDTYAYTPSVVGPEFSVADEDPAPFEEELRRREATLGPSHPSVAEAASNLAIIYNQRGDPARALPLYQRALNIWEMTHGPHHPDVAHALTDIAVILLEAGHDVQGKQLLRRALDIQIELLGPMHPDVVAIKDVLDE